MIHIRRFKSPWANPWHQTRFKHESHCVPYSMWSNIISTRNCCLQPREYYCVFQYARFVFVVMFLYNLFIWKILYKRGQLFVYLVGFRVGAMRSHATVKTCTTRQKSIRFRLRMSFLQLLSCFMHNTVHDCLVLRLTCIEL